MSELTGTWSLTRLALRRDRILLPAWSAVFVLFNVSAASATVGLYPYVGSRAEAASAINDIPSLVALYGRIYDPTSLGALATVKSTSLVAAMLAVFAIMLVVRHTRAEEENGRLELLGAAVVGRRAALTAALLVAAGTMVVIGVVTALGQTAVGLPAAGSWAFGLEMAGVGLCFAAVAAVAAQLTVSARAATGLALTVLAVAYVLRAVGDSSGDAAGPAFWSWLSPIGWGQQVRAYAGDRWAVLLLPVAFCALAVGAAYALASRRDLGAGLLPDRAGPAGASPRLSSPLGLAWRLQRGALLGWAVGYALLGLIMGNISADLGSVFDSPQAAELITRLGGTAALTDAYLALVLSVSAFVTGAYGVSTAMRLRGEEAGGRAEPMLAGAVSRTRWLASHVLVAVAGTTLLQTVIGVTAAASYSLQLGSWDRFGAVLGAALVWLPAVWVLAGLTVALFGLAPRVVALVWAALVGFVLVEELGALLSLPSWTRELSPFGHVPKLPGADMVWTPVLVLAVVAAALVLIGDGGFRRRDLDTA